MNVLKHYKSTFYVKSSIIVNETFALTGVEFLLRSFGHGDLGIRLPISRLAVIPRRSMRRAPMGSLKKLRPPPGNRSAVPAVVGQAAENNDKGQLGKK